MRSHLARVCLAVSFFALAACQADPQRAEVEECLAGVEPIATQLSGVGTRLEALTDAHPDPEAWGAAERTEMTAILERTSALRAAAGTVAAPEILKDIHPLLGQAIDEMQSAMQGVADVANDASKATEAAMNVTMSHADRSTTLGEQYIADLETSVRTAYPDLLRE